MDNINNNLLKPDSVERFYSKIEESDNCWLWKGAIQSKGYGSFSIDKKTYLAHRISYEIHHGEIPNGMLVLHKCDNRRCVNPDHLFLGTAQDNYDDMVAKGRKSPKSIRCKLSREQVTSIRSLRKEKNYSYRKIGSLFNLAPRTIGSIINYESWKIT